jgi:acetyl-CoA carboxylase carboxyl transferase subunit beta
LKLQKRIKKQRNEYITIKIPKPDVPKGLFTKCKKCGNMVLSEEVKEKGYVCPKCGEYFRIHAKTRIRMIADKGSFESWFEGMEIENPLQDEEYEKKLLDIKEKTKLDEAVITGKILIHGHPTAVAVMDGRFMMASMGSIVGEKITRTVERATKENLPMIIFSCSGGARMQEGIVSLMQMAKTSAALKRHSDGGNLYISVLTDPTTGGVTASFAMLGDVIIAEQGALVGFAGPRVIEQTIGQKLPKGFQRAEFLLEHGFVDMVLERNKIKQTLSEIVSMHYIKNNEIRNHQRQEEVHEECGAEGSVLSAWEKVQISRDNKRPSGEDYIENLFDDFIEFHGDRYYGDDSAVMGGIARFHGMPVTVIAQVKGHSTKENIKRNFGMPSPEGYRKALRLMKQAEKFHRPVVCFVDTPGAFCGIEAEERGQGEAIAKNLFEMSGICVPILSVFVGEGGSGGALALAVANEVWMLENSVYSVLSPEGYASILWKNGKLADKAADAMKMTAHDIKELNVIEKVLSEPDNYCVENMGSVIEQLDIEIQMFLAEKMKLTEAEIVEERYQRFRRM